MSEFLYLFRGGNPPGTPEQIQQQTQKWMAWLKDLTEKGHVKAPGQPLERTGKVVKSKGKAITDGPYAEKDLVGGYLIVEASNLAEAAEISSGSPIFETGGFVEVRPIMQINM